MDVPARIEAALAAARTARAQHDLPEARRALDAVWEHAQTLDEDHPLAHRLAWRRAKVAHDLDDPAGALALLEPLLPISPFEHYPAGLDACAAIAQALWSTEGYGVTALRHLLDEAHQAHLAAGDPYRAHQAHVWQAWDLACSGDLQGLTATLHRFADLHPDDLAGGPSRHSRAADAATSVPWLQQDVARTGLRAATWARDPVLAEAAEDLLEGSADDAGLVREEEYWFLEPIAMARLRLERPDPDRYRDTWLAQAPRLRHPRAGYHQALARAAAAPRDAAVAQLQRAAAEAIEGHYGAEWEIDPQVEIGRHTGTIPADALSRIRSHGVGVFRPT